jgi:hypothetical protein
MTLLQYCLWIVPQLLIAAVLVRFVRLGLQRQLPFFFSYLVCQLLQFITLFALNWLPNVSAYQYRWVLVGTQAIVVLLKFGIIYELTRELLLSHPSLPGVLKPLLRWISAALLLIAVAVSATFAASGMQRVEKLFHSLDFSSAVIQCGLLITLFLFTRALHISWRSSTAGIALGFGILAAIGLTTSAFHPASGTYQSIILDVIDMAAYQLCVMVWVGYLFLPERIAVQKPLPMQESDLALWDQEMQKMVQR